MCSSASFESNRRDALARSTRISTPGTRRRTCANAANASARVRSSTASSKAAKTTTGWPRARSGSTTRRVKEQCVRLNTSKEPARRTATGAVDGSASQWSGARSRRAVSAATQKIRANASPTRTRMLLRFMATAARCARLPMARPWACPLGVESAERLGAFDSTSPSRSADAGESNERWRARPREPSGAGGVALDPPPRVVRALNAISHACDARRRLRRGLPDGTPAGRRCSAVGRTSVANVDFVLGGCEESRERRAARNPIDARRTHPSSSVSSPRLEARGPGRGRSSSPARAPRG